MADLTYQVGVEVAGAQQNLSRLQGSIQGLNTAFTALNRVIGGLAIGAFVTSAVRMAAALDDVAGASGIALANVVGFGQAVAANGGSIEAANNGIARFANFIDEAADGNKKAQDTFLRLGISLKELGTLSEQDLLRKTIEGLGRMEAGAQRTALGMSIFGKSFNSVDFAAVNAGLDGFIQRAGPTATALSSAAKAEENFAVAINNLQVKILAALQPISELASAFLSAGGAVSKFIDVALNIAAIVGSFFLLGKAVTALVGGIAILARAPGLLIAGFASLKKTLDMFKSQLNAVKRDGEITSVTITALGTRFSFLSKGIQLVTSALATLGLAAYAAFEAVQAFLGNGNTQDLEKNQAAIEAERAALQRSTEEKIRAQEERRKVESAIKAETEALAKSVATYQASLQQANAKYQLETELLNVSERQRLVQEQLQQSETAYLQTITGLVEAYTKAKESGNLVDLEMLPKIQAAIQEVSAAYNEQIGTIQALTTARATANEQRALEAYRTQQQITFERDLQRLQDEVAKSTLPEIERKYYDIEAAARASGLAAVQAEEARRGARLTEAEAMEYYNAANRGADKLKVKTRELYESSRTFSAGWGRAFRAFADESMNASKRAEDLFRKATQGMEDAIVKFAKTGKFEFKEFVNMMAEELLRAQIQQLMAQLLGTGMGRPAGGGGGGGGGGFLGTIGSVIGGLFGGGGKKASAPADSGGGGFLKTIASAGSGILDFGKSIIGGIGDIFGGFFANGGMIPSGKIGIVGERGPEFISGPAQITPMMGGVTQVTYNINAVDAASFKQLVAQDPQFMFAVTEQGRRSLPQGRR